MYLKIHVLYHFLNHIFTTERSEVSMTFDVPHVSVFQPSLFSLFINDLASITGENIYVDCDMLADNTTLHTCGKHILQIRSNMQLDQISNWRDNNHMAINPIKTKSMTIATRQKHQLSPLSLDLILHWTKIYQVPGQNIVGTHILIMCVKQFQDESSFCLN